MSSLSGRIFCAVCAFVAIVASRGQTAIRINEVLTSNVTYTNTDNTVTDWVELINTSSAPVSLAGASLTDDELVPDKWTFPAGVSIGANGYMVIEFDPDRAASTVAGAFLNTGFSLSSKGGGVFFFGANFGPEIDAVRYGPQADNFSIGKVGGIWRLCTPTLGTANVTASIGSPLGLRINEWFANGTSDSDWFEVYNTGLLPVAMEGLYATDTLTAKTKSPVAPLTFIGPQGFIKFIADGSTNKGPDHVLFSFSKDGESIGLFDGSGAQIDAYTFGAQAVDVSEGRLPDGSAFITRFPGTASPGEPNYKELTNVVINELLSHTDPPIEDAVEFYNVTDSPVDISGWFLSNKKTDLKRYLIPAGTVIPAKSYKVIYEVDFKTNNPRVPFTFNSAHGDQVYLAQADAQGNLTGYRIGEEFEAAEHGVSFGRVETSVAGVHQFVAMARRTFGVDDPATVEEFRLGTGAPNSGPKIGPIVINEVMYHPASPVGTDDTADEFIELYNMTSSTVLLYDPLHSTNHWRLQNGVSFLFPANQSIPPFGYVLVLSFDPNADQIGASNFRTKYNVPISVPLYGPYLPNLKNSGASLELNKPDPPQEPPHPDAGFVPYIRVDKVNFSDSAPWDATADGTGFSLQRRSVSAFGNDPINWAAAAPTAGVANSAALLDTDRDGMPDQWEDANGFDKNNPADAALDADGDGYTNLQEYIAGTNPRNAASYLKVTSVVPAQSSTTPLHLSFTAVANHSYSVLYRNSLAISSTWQTLQTIPADTVDRTITVDDPNAFGRTDRYYQIVTPAN